MKDLKGSLVAGAFMGFVSYLFIKAGVLLGLKILPALMVGWALVLIVISPSD